MTVVHREVCTVIQELRDFMEHFLSTVEPAEFFESDAALLVQAQHVRQRAHIFAALEEIQYHVNRMEASLHMQKDYAELKEEYSKLQKKIKRLEARRKKK